MVMLVEYIDTVFENSTRESELLIGFGAPYTSNIITDPAKKQTAVAAHEKFFADRGIEFRIYGPFFNSGFIVGGNVYWADCADNIQVLAEYEKEFETDGISSDPATYMAAFYSVSKWHQERKSEWDKYRQDPEGYFAGVEW
jgi:hypothetical protein